MTEAGIQPDHQHLPTAGSPEPGSVRLMFSRLAHRYDRLNTVLSLGEDRRWRRRAAQLARVDRGGRALDLCTGTGALAALLSRRVSGSGEVIGLDLTEEMLEVARQRVPEVSFVTGDATSLSFPDQSFDAVTMGFGLRNIRDHQAALQEARRVLRPGGRLVVLEFSQVSGWFAPIYRAYSKLIIPRLAMVILGSDEAYRYLTSSIAKFPRPLVVAGWMSEAGLTDIRVHRMSMGIVAVHVGRRAPDQAGTGAR